MTGSYRLAPQAELDLNEIWFYISGDNLVAADRTIDLLVGKFAMLARQPLIGEIREELVSDLRSFPVGNYVIYYRPQKGDVSVEIVRVIHGARDVNRLF